MLTAINPKLPMRDKAATHEFYITSLGFSRFGGDYPDYLMVERDGLQLHFFLFRDIDPGDNYGQVYIRTDNIDELYDELVSRGMKMRPLETKPWGQREFSLTDPDNNLLTFGQGV